MQITINKPRITVLVALITIANFSMFFLAPQNGRPQIKPKHPAMTLFLDIVGILAGIAVQVWTRDKPKYKSLRLFAYLFTLVMCSALSFGLIATLMGRFF